MITSKYTHDQTNDNQNKTYDHNTIYKIFHLIFVPFILIMINIHKTNDYKAIHDDNKIIKPVIIMAKTSNKHFTSCDHHNF